MRRLIVFLSSLSTVSPFPWVPAQQEIDPEPLRFYRHDRRQADCPFNANHEPAATYNANFPYTGARNGLPGTGKGGIKVPADGDKAHAFQAPTAKDVRGPCPGLNAAANVRTSGRDICTSANEFSTTS